MNEIKRQAEVDREKSVLLLDRLRSIPEKHDRSVTPAKFEAD